MQPDNDQNSLQNKPYSGTGGERVIQPLDPGLQVPAPDKSAWPANPNPTSSTPASPSEEFEHTVPTLDLKKPIAESSPGRLAVQHKSLMGLAIVGFISTVFLAYSAIMLNSAINKAIAENKNIGAAKTDLYIIWVTIAVNLVINTYFLFARNRHTVALILKILLVLELFNLLSAATGIGGSKALGFVLDGGYTIYIFIVLTVIRTPPPM